MFMQNQAKCSGSRVLVLTVLTMLKTILPSLPQTVKIVKHRDRDLEG